MFMLWRILSLGCKLRIKISPEQGHAAHTHTARKHSALPQSMHQPPFLPPASLPAPSQPCLLPGDGYTELGSWLHPRGRGGHLPMQGQGGTHGHTELARRTHTSRGHTHGHRPRTRRGLQLPRPSGHTQKPRDITAGTHLDLFSS